MQVSQVSVHDGAGGGDAAGVGEQVDVEVRALAGRGGDFLPGRGEHPLDEPPGRPVVAGIADDPAQEDARVLVDIVDLLAQRKARAEQVAADFPVHEQHEGRLRLPVGVVGRQVIGEEFAVLEDRVDRVAQKAGFTTELPDAGAVGSLKFADFKLAAFRHH